MLLCIFLFLFLSLGSFYTTLSIECTPIQASFQLALCIPISLIQLFYWELQQSGTPVVLFAFVTVLFPVCISKLLEFQVNVVWQFA